MLPLGLLLLAATGVCTGLLIAENHDTGPGWTVTLAGRDLATANGLELFLAGIAVALLFAAGLALALVGRRRAARRSAELRAARKVLRGAGPDGGRPGSAPAPAPAPVKAPTRTRRLAHRFGL